MKAARRLKLLLPTIGRAGDVHPVLALGTALQSRGHRATFLTNPLFQELIERQGVGFLPVGTIDDALRIADEGKRQRADAERQLVACEAELKQALISARQRAGQPSRRA